MDLEKRFDQHGYEQTPETRIVVANIGEIKIGMIVAGVSEVLNIEENAIEKTPVIVTTVDAEFITGVAKVDDRLVILLDLERVLSTHEKVDLAELAVP